MYPSAPRVFLPSPARPESAKRAQSGHAVCRGLPTLARNRRPYEPSSFPFGLRTPPGDDMGTAYHAPSFAPYETHHVPLPGYSTVLHQPDRSMAAMAPGQPARQGHHPLYPSLPQPLPQHAVTTRPPQPSSRRSTRPSTPAAPHQDHMPAAHPGSRPSARDAASLTMHSLRLPSCLDPEEGNLSQFAAQITCLFWFEAPKTLKAAEAIHEHSPVLPVPRLAPDAIPSHQFTKWVETVLRTTQVTQNVVLLALMFIYRLKMTNPTVRGRAGSEYRLLTVALMLGNKFLDDNTYTNKTWAEVSGISVQEIHVMEVEFLSNMRYSLLASKEEWDGWLLKLADYLEYCKRAKEPMAIPALELAPAPHDGRFTSPLASPTEHLPLVMYSQPRQPVARTYSPSPAHYAGEASQQWPAPFHAQAAVSPLAARPDLGNTRKRSLTEDDLTEPPAKRTSRQPPATLPHSSTARPLPTAAVQPIRLPIPSLTLNTTASGGPSQGAYIPGYSQQQQPPTAPPPPSLSLPPLAPGVRAMTTVYPPASSAAWAPQLAVVATSGPVSSTSHAAAAFPATDAPYGTPTKRQSPMHNLTPAFGASSPLTDGFSHHPGVRTPISNSPLFYLEHRSSPYKPIRDVKTLLYPPPSASLQEYHLSGAAVPPTQMHYQPLGRRHEFRTGILPEFQNQLLYGGSGLARQALTPIQPVPTHGQRLAQSGPGQPPS